MLAEKGVRRARKHARSHTLCSEHTRAPSLANTPDKQDNSSAVGQNVGEPEGEKRKGGRVRQVSSIVSDEEAL